MPPDDRLDVTLETSQGGASQPAASAARGGPGGMGADTDYTGAGNVTFRSILIGLLLIPLNCYWIMEVEGIWHSGHPTAMSIMWNVVFNIFCLVLINMGIKKVAPRWALTQAELIVIYVMLSIASALAGHDTLQLGLPAMTHAFWFATEENHWAELFHPYLPKWLTVSEQTIIKPYYEGSSTLYTPERIMAWIGPVIWWTVFILALGVVMLCINVIIRKQWTENEKLSFPLIELPLAVTQRGGAADFFRNNLLWLGFGFGFALDLINGLHNLYPNVPYFPVRHDEHNIGRGFTDPPWNAANDMPFPLYPFVVGLGFVLPTDLSFSLWFFYLFKKSQLVFSSAIGAGQLYPRFPYFSEQTYGAWLAIFMFAVYTARTHLREVWKHILTGRSALDDRNEPLTYRQAAAGIVLGFSFLVYFCVRANMELWVVLLFFAMYLVLAVGIIRVRAEIGPPAHEMAGTNVPIIMIDFLGTRGISNFSMNMFALLYWFTGRGYRTMPWPYQLEAMKMAERTGMNYRGMGAAMMLALWFGGLATYWAGISLHYGQGVSANGLVAHAGGQWGEVQDRIQNPRGPDAMAMAFVGIGFAFTCFLTYMRTYFLWWPFHPAGYAISTQFGAEYYWSAIMIAWLLKTLVLRYGGYKTYRRALPLMFGLVLGEYTMGAFWSVLSVLLQQRTYDFAPG